MQNQSIFYIVFLLTLSVAVVSTYITTKSLVTNDLAADYQRKLAGVSQHRQTQISPQAGVTAHQDELVFAKLRCVLAQISQKLFQLPHSISELKNLGVDIENLSLLLKTPTIAQRKSLLNNLTRYAEKLNHVYQTHIPLRLQFIDDLNQYHAQLTQLNALIDDIYAKQSIEKLSRLQQYHFGRFARAARQVEVSVARIQQHLYRSEFNNLWADHMVRAITGARGDNQLLLKGNSEKNMRPIGEEDIKTLVEKTSPLLQKLYDRSTAILATYTLLSLQPGELKELREQAQIFLDEHLNSTILETVR